MVARVALFSPRYYYLYHVEPLVVGEGSPSVCVEGIIVLGSDVRVSPVLSGFRWVGWLRFFLILLGVSLAGGAVWLFTVGGAKVTSDQAARRPR